MNIIRFFFFLIYSVSYSATYYVSTSGNDSYTQAQAQNQTTPWKSLLKVNSFSFASGDHILFKKGDTWNGNVVVLSSGSNNNPITYGAYGSGGNPIIKGTVTVAGPWTQQSGSIYWASVAENIDRLFLNGQPLMLARYPNTGYLTINDAPNSTSLRCNALNSVNWTGATVHIRTEHWTIATKKITASDAGQKTLTVNAAPIYGLKSGWGFFINNKLEALDSAGEWYYDSLAHRLYVWTPNGSTPANYLIEGSTYKNGFTVTGKLYLDITGFTIFGHSECGIKIDHSSNIIVDGNTVLYPDAYGVNIDCSNITQNNTVKNNTITGANFYGILAYSAGSTFIGNNIKNIAILSLFTKSGMGDMCCSGLGMEIHGDNIELRNNVMDSIGYIGIRTFDVNNKIEYNFIQHCCLSKDDGAGIDSGWQPNTTDVGTAGTIIQRNIVCPQD